MCRPLLRAAVSEQSSSPTAGTQKSDSVRLDFFRLALTAAESVILGSGSCGPPAVSPAMAASVGCRVSRSRSSSSTASIGTGRGVSVGAAVGERADWERRWRDAARLRGNTEVDKGAEAVLAVRAASLMGVTGAVERRLCRLAGAGGGSGSWPTSLSLCG